LVLANGLFKPNVSSIVGELYEKNDPRRDGGFTIFYMGINIGALIPPLILGWLVSHVGWHSGFLLAAFGMFISLATFWIGRGRLKNKGSIPVASFLHKSKTKTLRFYLIFIFGLILAIYLDYYLDLEADIPTTKRSSWENVCCVDSNDHSHWILVNLQ
jgi:POT family proton-dependent oligopeptide transporter